MNAFAMILVIMSAPVDVAANAPLTLEPDTSIRFEATTEKKVAANCERVRKAIVASGMTAFCGNVEAISE